MLTAADIQRIRWNMGISQVRFAYAIAVEPTFFDKFERGYKPVPQWLAYRVNMLTNRGV